MQKGTGNHIVPVTCQSINTKVALKLTFAVDHSSTAVEGESTVSGVPKIKQEQIHIQVEISSVRCSV